MKVEGSVAIVVGASGGIGAATVRALARRGARLVLAAPEAEIEALTALAAEAQSLGTEAIAVPADIARRDAVDRLVAYALDGFGTIDVLINVAGVSSSPSLADDRDEDLERVLSVNLLGCARTIHAVVPTMKARGRGAIVNVGSIAGEAGVMGMYSASKFGLRGLTDTVRRELRADGIGVTLIEPGFVATPLNHAMGVRLPRPDIVADAIVSAIERPRRCWIVPWYYRPPVAIAKAFPGLIDLVFGDRRIQDRLNRDARADRAREERAAAS